MVHIMVPANGRVASITPSIAGARQQNGALYRLCSMLGAKLMAAERIDAARLKEAVAWLIFSGHKAHPMTAPQRPNYSTAHSFVFGGETLVSVDTAALWWPREEALIVADLHLEKGSWFAARGQMLPPYDSAATIKRLTALAQMWDARAIYCLGDNFHDDAGVARLSDQAVEALHQLSARSQIHWIVGNHDSGIIEPTSGAPAGGKVYDDIAVHGLTMQHIARSNPTQPELSGHYHPKLRTRLQDRVVSRPCFVMDDRKLILPAFGAYAGGLDIYDEAIQSHFPQGMTALVHTKARLCQFSVSVAEGEIACPSTVA